jgi:hypothetical protein
MNTNELTFVEQECREWLASINQSIDEDDYIGAMCKETQMPEALMEIIPDNYLTQLHDEYYTFVSPFNNGGQKVNLKRIIVAQIITQEKTKLQTAS